MGKVHRVRTLVIQKQKNIEKSEKNELNCIAVKNKVCPDVFAGYSTRGIPNSHDEFQVGNTIFVRRILSFLVLF